ncbi:MAG: MFS transporter [Paludibacterium sp.]|uniref:MFS transporter n=1 Tax=Paludibacterium sp. TaxID=1917523 RepID=UPI0025CC15E8|nr:MFS transporter [Paludibacterium sp.]MBV8046967.1 MFS transporter [Paludibacterium sp.]MBV8648099.1 MFS transporter [Paludibacterium sp.]
MHTDTQQARLTPLLTGWMAAACGLAVASIYYAQPLLPAMAVEFHLDTAGAGGIVTVAQIGYALGLFLIVPLGDLLERRRLIAALSALTALGLLICALSTSTTVFLLGTLMSGLCSAVAQILVPFAATLADPARRGKAVGTVMSGLLLGILLARTAAGLLASLSGWRTIYWVGFAVLMLMTVVLARQLPRYRLSAGLTYPGLLLSVLNLLAGERRLQLRASLGMAAFGAFSVFWTSLAFLLSAPPYTMSSASIGLFGLVGAVGAASSSLTGRLADKGHGSRATTLALAGLVLSWLPLAFAGHSLWALLLGVLLLDWVVQAVHVSNQNAIYRLAATAHNRLNAAYMTCNFIGMAGGSLLSAWAFGAAGWGGVVAAGAAVSVAGFAIWAAARRFDVAPRLAED